MISKEKPFMILLSVVSVASASRILAVFLTPSVSHQIAYRPLTQSLAERGHEVVVVTTDPAFPKGQNPTNLTEIDIHDISYKPWRDMRKVSSGQMKTIYEQQKCVLNLINVMFPEQVKNIEQNELLEENFDLVIIEATVFPAVVFGHKLQIPMLLITSYGKFYDYYDIIGSKTHPLLHPPITRDRAYNLSMLEQIKILIGELRLNWMVKTAESKSEIMLSEHFGENLPPLDVLKNDVTLFFMNIHPVLDDCPPVPLGLVSIMDINYSSNKLPGNLQYFMDNSTNGVIYVSFGTNVISSLLPPNTEKLLMETFSKLPYDILLKWETEEIPGKSSNVKVRKWFPQVDILSHPKLRLFINQAGLQSTLESIRAGVPMIGIPVMFDQWLNAEKYVRLGIGMKLNVEQLSEKILIEAITSVIGNKRYRENIARLRLLISDQPMRPLDRAVWWTEHVLRHGGARHLRSPAANLPWTQYYEVELIAIISLVLSLLIASMYLVLKLILRYINKMLKRLSKLYKKEL